MNEQATFHIDEWRSSLAGQVSFSASEVQGRLFDLYGDLEGIDALDGSLAQVKAYLLLTRQRELFGADELGTMLDELELAIEMAGLGEPTPA